MSDQEKSEKKKIPPHNCEEHKVSDGGGLDPRNPGKTWVTTYRCGKCGAFLGRETEQLD
ncbi:MAG: hypothetical protein KJI72_02975 [Patescibacteria group bacterium]|nr:hypothetical protein [Patescibacteria group bacterium]